MRSTDKDDANHANEKWRNIQNTTNNHNKLITIAISTITLSNDLEIEQVLEMEIERNEPQSRENEKEIKRERIVERSMQHVKEK